MILRGLKLGMSNFLNTSDRCSRTDFFAIQIGFLVPCTIAFALFGYSNALEPKADNHSIVLFFAQFVLAIHGMIIPFLSLSCSATRRLNDAKVPPMPIPFLSEFLRIFISLLIGPTFPIYFALAIGMAFAGEVIFALIIIGIAAIPLGIAMLIPSDPNTNQYGPNPHALPQDPA